jgi:exosortase
LQEHLALGGSRQERLFVFHPLVPAPSIKNHVTLLPLRELQESMQRQEEGLTGRLEPDWRRLWLGLCSGIALLGVMTWPTWRWLWQEWMANDYYSHGILIPPVAIYLAWRRWWNQRLDLGDELRNSNFGFLVLVTGVGAYLYFFQERAYYLAAFATIGSLAGLVWIVAGSRLARLWAFPVAYLVLMVPLPFVERVTLPLALFTGVCSAALVKFLGLNITLVGNAISLPNADLVIGAQCSGINSMIALTSLHALVAYVIQGPLWARVSLILLAVPIAMLGNVLRVANLLFVAGAWGAEAAFRFYHDYSGLVFFGIALLLLLPLTRLLGCRQLRIETL